MRKDARSLDRLFKKGVFAALMARIELHRALEERIKRLLPAGLAEHCTACVLRDHALILYTDSAAWATPLRFAGPALLAELAQADQDVRRIVVRVIPSGAPEQAAPRERATSSAPARWLRDAARSAAQPEIRAALARLAETLQGPQS